MFKFSLKKLKKQKNFTKDQKSFWLNINFYWEVAVFVMFVIITLSSFFGYYLFVKTNQKLVLETNDTNAQLNTIKKERIDKVLEYFSIKNKKSDQILNSPAPIVDPSL